MDRVYKIMSKKIIGIFVVVLVITGAVVGINNINKPSIQQTVDALPITFTGYNGSGYMTFKKSSKAEKSSYNLLKSIALVDAKAADIDISKIKKIIKENPTNANELKTHLTSSDSYSVSLNESTKYQKFIDHLQKTNIDTGSRELKNGDKVKLTVQDTSDSPYFKKVTKTYTVRGLKKSNVVNLSLKNFTIKTTGTNGYGFVTIKYGTKQVFSSANSEKNYINGDIVTLTSKVVTGALNTKSVKYKLNGDKVTFKISSFEDATMPISNLNDFGDNAYISVPSKSDITSPTLEIFTKSDNGGYTTESYMNGVTLKDGKLEKGNYSPELNFSSLSPEKEMATFDNKYVYRLVQK